MIKQFTYNCPLSTVHYPLITILGPTACGKTSFACRLAYRLGGEILSADSRQVYRGMDIGTGKDLEDYTIDGKKIPYHLIDIRNAGEQYNIFEYQKDFHKAYQDVLSRGVQPILCGGSGLYIESVLKGYKLVEVPVNIELRETLKEKSLQELTSILKTYKTLHNTTDVDTVKRAIRAIEIEEYYKSHDEISGAEPIDSIIIGIDIDRESRRTRITERLKLRLENGMVDEVKGLIDSGVKTEALINYGLEYKYIALYLLGKLTYDEMCGLLEIAIHQFAKRQMTWFRGMEKHGFHINWIDYSLPDEEKVSIVTKMLQ